MRKWGDRIGLNIQIVRNSRLEFFKKNQNQLVKQNKTNIFAPALTLNEALNLLFRKTKIP